MTKSSRTNQRRFHGSRAAWRLASLPLALVLAVALGACSDDDRFERDGDADDDDSAAELNATAFRVTVANVSQPQTLATDRANGTVPLSPGIFTVFNASSNPAFEEGALASTGIARIAEDGFPTAPLGTALGTVGGAAGVTSSGLFAQPDGNLAALEAGESATFTLIASPGDRLTLQTMFVQSNDWFYALDGLALFDDDGEPVSGDVTGEVELYDAGTEADTAPGTGPDQKPAQAPTAVNQGPDEDTPILTAVVRHPGFDIPANEDVINVTIEPLEDVAATTFDVRIDNDSNPGTLNTDRAGGAVPLSPGVYAVFTGDNPVFTPGELADIGTERIAEDGFISDPLGSEIETLASIGDAVRAGTFNQPDGMVPALEPGESTTFAVTATPGELFTLETMFVQSNDWFYALDGLALFDADGEPISGDVTGAVELYDAGTEADTAPGTGPDQKPVQDPFAVNQGPDESVPIELATERHMDFNIPINSQVLRVTITPRSE